MASKYYTTTWSRNNTVTYIFSYLYCSAQVYSSTSQTKRNHIIIPGRKSTYFGLTCSRIKQVGKTSLLVDSSFIELINPLFLNMMQPHCKWITPEQPGSLIHVTPVWQQAITYSQHLLYTVSYYLQQLMTFYS